MVSTKAAFSDYSGLFELESNAGDGQKNQQIVGVISLQALSLGFEDAPVEFGQSMENEEVGEQFQLASASLLKSI